MSKVLILTPKEFKCFSKFERKIKKIIYNLDDITLCFFSDYNNFISKLSQENNYKYRQISDMELASMDYAIIFEDQYSTFDKEKDVLSSKKIPTRVIQILITKVINIKNEPNFNEIQKSTLYEYIGRGSYWGNPYSMFEDGEDRDEVIRKFKYDFDRDLFPNKEKQKVYNLTGKILGCFCKPNSCHGDVLADYLNSYDDGK